MAVLKHTWQFPKKRSSYRDSRSEIRLVSSASRRNPRRDSEQPANRAALMMQTGIKISKAAGREIADTARPVAASRIASQDSRLPAGTPAGSPVRFLVGAATPFRSETNSDSFKPRTDQTTGQMAPQFDQQRPVERETSIQSIHPAKPAAVLSPPAKGT
ncbi:MAG: hypothetical protein PHS88_01585, partial [Candidatus Omnitrophica bacterium]|nr:hypothetical protein [Candidatus Omnitrophota bacterium]